jgi:hypothetical protein
LSSSSITILTITIAAAHSAIATFIPCGFAINTEHHAPAQFLLLPPYVKLVKLPPFPYRSNFAYLEHHFCIPLIPFCLSIFARFDNNIAVVCYFFWGNTASQLASTLAKVRHDSLAHR